MKEQCLPQCGVCGNTNEAKIHGQPVRLTGEDLSKAFGQQGQGVEPGGHILCHGCLDKAKPVLAARLGKSADTLTPHDMF